MVLGRFPAGTNPLDAVRDMFAPVRAPAEHRRTCAGIWDLRTLVGGPLAAGFQRVTCHRCGLVVYTIREWAHIDYEAACQALDPDGHMRAFLDVADLAPHLPPAS